MSSHRHRRRDGDEDAALIQAAGIPAVIFGPPGGGIHAADEWVNLSGLERFEQILLNVTRSFCG